MLAITLCSLHSVILTYTSYTLLCIACMSYVVHFVSMLRYSPPRTTSHSSYHCPEGHTVILIWHSGRTDLVIPSGGNRKPSCGSNLANPSYRTQKIARQQRQSLFIKPSTYLDQPSLAISGSKISLKSNYSPEKLQLVTYQT